jgi:Cu(I)/Ag(I) efflux system membrane fusion protein
MSCNGNKENNATTAKEEPKQSPISKLNENGTMKLINVLLKYYDLKNTFVKTDGTEATIAAEKLTLVTTDAQVYAASDSIVNIVIGLHLDSIKNASLDISSLSPGDVETMRSKFETISNNLYEILKKVEMKNAGVYHEFCPMAFNDKGAFWLSDELEIKNPYFGKKMLSCGEVVDSLK